MKVGKGDQGGTGCGRRRLRRDRESDEGAWQGALTLPSIGPLPQRPLLDTRVTQQR